MIALATDCLVFRMATGESVPFSADAISGELVGEHDSVYDSEMVGHAANAVFHYFKHELGYQTVTVGEFAAALDKVLHGLKLNERSGERGRAALIRESDLCALARECRTGGELAFFPRLREELRQHLRQGCRVIRFHGVRRCAKQLCGAHRWSLKCQAMQEQIVEYLRKCLRAECEGQEMALVVE
jgi:hypothetical protein